MATATLTTRKRMEALPDTCKMVLTIRGVDYAARPIHAEDGRAFRLRNLDNGKLYDVAETPHGPTCDCGDQTFRHEGIDNLGCKHIRSCRALGLID